MLEIGLNLDWDREHLTQVFGAGIAKHPDGDDLYFTMWKALLPMWGGDLKTIDRFIAWADKNAHEKRGLKMYARLYVGLSYSQVHQTLFTSTNAS
ncbi:hypothetical protein CSQ96_19670 [Janthinobacterium sp. BJB412]|nr:hypothetical protein CSQ96_19670 [Janthinobacterium sp. BJB412]